MDVSGFTALTEMLEATSENGAEQLGFYLNRYFERMVKMINASGGDIMKFVGDALIVLWQPDYKRDVFDNQVLNLKSMACRAAECALLVQDELHGAELAKNVRFSVKVGISCEHVTIMHLGGLCNRVEFTASGQALLDAFECESYCKPGDTVVSAQLWAHIRDNFSGLEIPHLSTRGSKKHNHLSHPKKQTVPSVDCLMNSKRMSSRSFAGQSSKSQSQTRSRRRHSVDESLSMNKISFLEPLEIKPQAAHGSKRGNRNSLCVSTLKSTATEAKEGESTNDCFVRLLANKKRMKKISVRKALLKTQREVDCLKLYVPGAVKSFIDGFQSTWSADIRLTTVCFVNLKLEALNILSNDYSPEFSSILQSNKQETQLRNNNSELFSRKEVIFCTTIIFVQKIFSEALDICSDPNSRDKSRNRRRSSFSLCSSVSDRENEDYDHNLGKENEQERHESKSDREEEWDFRLRYSDVHLAQPWLFLQKLDHSQRISFSFAKNLPTFFFLVLRRED